MNEIRVGQVWRDCTDNEEVLITAIGNHNSLSMRVIREKDGRVGDQRAFGYESASFSLNSLWVLCESSTVNEILNKYEDIYD